jgi:nitrate/nitrite transporter NarK
VSGQITKGVAAGIGKFVVVLMLPVLLLVAILFVPMALRNPQPGYFVLLALVGAAATYAIRSVLQKR